MQEQEVLYNKVTPPITLIDCLSQPVPVISAQKSISLPFLFLQLVSKMLYCTETTPAVPFSLFNVPSDEVIVHVKQANPEQIEHDIQAMSQGHSFVVSLAECSQSSLLAKQNLLL